MLSKLNPFKKSLAGLLAVFTTLSEQLTKLAAERLAEAQAKESKARALMAEVEAAEREAEDALAVADRIDALVGNSVL